MLHAQRHFDRLWQDSETSQLGIGSRGCGFSTGCLGKSSAAFSRPFRVSASTRAMALAVWPGESCLVDAKLVPVICVAALRQLTRMEIPKSVLGALEP